MFILYRLQRFYGSSHYKYVLLLLLFKGGKEPKKQFYLKESTPNKDYGKSVSKGGAFLMKSFKSTKKYQCN